MKGINNNRYSMSNFSYKNYVFLRAKFLYKNFKTQKKFFVKKFSKQFAILYL